MLFRLPSPPMTILLIRRVPVILPVHRTAQARRIQQSNSSVPSGTVIIDNGDSGTSATGAWSVSAGTGPYGTDSVFSKTVSGTYSFETDRTGLQEVYLWWTYRDSRYTQVPVQIYDGTEILNTVIVNQQQDGSQWNFLGTYTFSGTAKVVIVSSSSSESTCADAVKFVVYQFYEP